MGVTSGVIPYEYAGPLPFLIRPDMEPIGFSGILFEQAHFVLAAELRRWSTRFAPTGDDPIVKYVNQPAGISEASEASGCIPFFLTHPPVYPGGSNYVNQLLNMRDMFDSLMIDIFLDSDYDLTDLKIDWLNNACPNPSGENGDFRRREPDPDTEVDDLGRIISLDFPQEEVLGFSGQLYDVDLCEMRYQPYTRFARTRYTNVHNSTDSGGDINGSEFLILTQPVWPAFHKLDGSLVSLNSRDAALTFAVPGRVLPFEVGRNEGVFFYGNGTGYDSVGSGYIQLDGDVFLDTTDYQLAPSGQGFSTGFTFQTHGSRKLGRSHDGTNGVGRVYVTGSARARNIYFVGAENTKANTPFGVLPSGFVSKWPRPEHMELQPWQAGNSDGQRAFEVFDEAFWMEDAGSASSGPSQRPASGLAIVSPNTGTFMWLRFADQREIAAGSLPGFSQRWGDFAGLERIATNRIIRLTSNRFDDGSGDQLAFMEYNDDLDFVAENRATAAVGGSNPVGMFHDPDNGLFVVMEPTFFPSARDVYTYSDTTFAIVEEFEGGTTWPTNGARLNGEYWGFNGGDVVSRHIQRFELVVDAAPNVDLFETKIVQVEVIPGLSGEMGNFGVSDAQVVAGTTDITPGIWFLCTSSNGSWFLRVEEDTTAWVPQEAIQVNPDQLHGADFIVMDVD